MENTTTPDILILGLSNGDQILASVVETAGAYLCSDILAIVFRDDEATGEMRMGLMPFMPYADPAGGFIVPTIMATVAIPSQKLLRHYQQSFGKIITPPESKIILS